MEQHHQAKFAFYYMLSLVALVFLAISSGMIVFQIINKSIIDVIDTYNRYDSGAIKLKQKMKELTPFNYKGIFPEIKKINTFKDSWINIDYII